VAESTVFGARAGETAVLIASTRPLRKPGAGQPRASLARAVAPLRKGGGDPPHLLMRELQEVMWSGCGLVRSSEGLRAAGSAIRLLLERANRLAVPGPAEWNLGWQQALDVVNQLQVAQTMVDSALVREESRGAHFREDFPERRDESWLRYVTCRVGGDGEVTTQTHPVVFTRSRPPAAVAGALS
jgi:succinate dehydrogenase/fumarate reductase flavoprotein subunit